MSTRATYKITDKLYDKGTREMTFYIHHDGYKEGAAHYFYNMIETHTGTGEGYQTNSKGGNIEAFLRANYNAEITESHEVHGDTEFRYNLNPDNTLEVSEVSWNGDNTDTNTEEIGLIDFINKYHDKKVIEIESEYGYKQIHTLDTLSALVTKETDLLKLWDKNGYEGSANYESLEKRILIYSEGLNKLTILMGINSPVTTD